jgi:hypothetical protein
LKSDTEKVNWEIGIKKFGFIANKKSTKIDTDIGTVTFGKLMHKSNVQRNTSVLYDIDMAIDGKDDGC